MNEDSPPDPSPPSAERPQGRKRLRRVEGETEEERQLRKAENRRKRLRRRRIREPFLRATAWLLGCLPVAVAAWLGEILGLTAFRFAKFARSRVLTHLNIAFGTEKSEEELQRIARDNFRLMGRALFALPAFAGRDPEYLRSRMEIVDADLMLDPIANGRGMIVLSHHFGLFDAAGVWLVHDYNGVVVGRDGAETGPTRLVISMREKLGVNTIERGNTRAIVRALKDARVVGMLADQDVEDLNGVFVPFFGRLAHTPLGPAALAVRAKAPVIPTVVEWTSRTTVRLRVLGVLYAREDLPRAEAAHELTYRYTKLGEDAIRERPEHWAWIHKRWATRPEDRPELPVWEPRAAE